MANWYMLTLIGVDQKGIVASITQQLANLGANLGEAQMQRLGTYFTIMLMVQYDGDETSLIETLSESVQQLGLKVHVDAIQGHLHQHREPNVQIRFYGADRIGIVASVTDTLSKAGLHILDLQTDVGGTEDNPIFIMHIEGYAQNGIDALRQACASLNNLDITIEPLDTVVA